jgi:hypothetical protein
MRNLLRFWYVLRLASMLVGVQGGARGLLRSGSWLLLLLLLLLVVVKALPTLLLLPQLLLLLLLLPQLWPKPRMLLLLPTSLHLLLLRQKPSLLLLPLVLQLRGLLLLCNLLNCKPLAAAVAVVKQRSSLAAD